MDLADHFRQRLEIWSDIQDHLQFLHDTVAARTQPAVIELGVRSGNSTAALLDACARARGHLWSCDINPPQVPAEFYAGPWSFRAGDSVSEAVLGWMPAECDVLFIDTSHTFEQTMAELDQYMPRVIPGGIALFHDTQWLSPAISLTECGGPVTDALDAWCKQNRREWHNRKSEPGFYGLGYIEC